MKRSEACIPNHNREAVSEALEAALYCAAFQRLEEAEMKQLMRNIRRTGEYPEAAEKVRRRLNRRRGLSALRRAVPRAAQAAAAIIAVVSIGTGIALATSPAARQWAAGALVSRVTDPDGFFGEVRSSLTDGAAVGGRLMVVEDNERVSVYEGTDAQPTTYEWRNAGNRTVSALAAEGDDVYAVYALWEGEPESAFDLGRMPVRYGLGRVTLDGDGSFEIAALAEMPMTSIFDPEGRALESWGIHGGVLKDGRLYLVADYDIKEPGAGFSFAPGHVRLFGWSLADGTLSELDLTGVALDWSPELFGGAGGAFLAAYDDGAAAVQVWRVAGESLEPVCRVPYSGTERPDSFARRESDDALLYVLDGSVYLAPDMDPSRAARVAVCGEVSGHGLLLDETTYAVVQGGSVEVFDLTTPLGEVNELVVDGDAGNDDVNQAFIAGHPGVAVVSDPGYGMEDIGDYAELMLAGKARGDAITLDCEGFEKVRDAGLVAPLTDPELVAEWRLMPESLQRYLSVNGQPAAIPESFYTYSDVLFLPETWEAVRGSLADYPDTWLDYVNWLSAFSHGEAAGKYIFEFDGAGGAGLDMPAQFKVYTVWRMAEAFARCWRAMGEDIDFTKPEFTACMDVLEGVDWSAMRYEDSDAGAGERRAAVFTFTYDPVFSEDDWFIGARTLRIREDAPKLSRASGYFAFVPASSTSKATAQEYLKALAAINHTMPDGSLNEAAGYDFATDPQTLAAEAGDVYTADSIRRYREQVGDVAFRAKPDRETIIAIRDAVVRYVGGQESRGELLEYLNEVYQ